MISIRKNGRASWDDNNAIWFSDKEINYDEEFEKFRELIKIRKEWFNNNIDVIGENCFVLTYEINGEITKTETYKAFSPITKFGERPKKEGYSFNGWIDKDTQEKVDYLIINKNTTLIPDFVEE